MKKNLLQSEGIDEVFKITQVYCGCVYITHIMEPSYFVDIGELYAIDV